MMHSAARPGWGPSVAWRSAALAVWRSPSRWLVPILVAIDLGCVWSRTDWRGDWPSTIDWVGGPLAILGPIVAGIGGWRALASARGLGEAAEIGGMSWRATAVEVGGVFAWSSVAQLATLAVALVASARWGTPGLPDLLPVVPQLTLLLGYAGIGVLVVNLAPSPLAPPLVVAALLYFSTQVAVDSRAGLWVNVGGASAPLNGSHYSVHVLLAQSVLAVGVAALAVAVRRRIAAPRLEMRPLVLACAVVPIVFSARWLATWPDQYVSDDAVPPLTCIGSGPRVCVTPNHRELAPQFQSLWAEESRFLLRAGVATVPSEFDERDPLAEEPRGHQTFSTDTTVDGQAVDGQAASLYMLMPARCLAGSAPPPTTAIDRVEAAADYLVTSVQPDVRLGSPDPGLARLRAMSEGRTFPWLVATVHALSGCRFNAVPKPPS
jgi:hypothetical protein